jgi:hypothetical protein
LGSTSVYNFVKDQNINKHCSLLIKKLFGELEILYIEQDLIKYNFEINLILDLKNNYLGSTSNLLTLFKALNQTFLFEKGTLVSIS